MVNSHFGIRNLKDSPNLLRQRSHLEIANLPLGITNTTEFGGSYRQHKMQKRMENPLNQEQS